jgi:RNA polymerase sigma-70 factor (ECF subfamily)
MHDYADRLAGFVTADDELSREFELRLADSSSLAIRVAYSVLRNRQDAEDVAQDAFVRAHRRFAGLRDREKFRSWLVRLTWRLALDWRRGHRRREVREQAVAVMRPPVGDAEADAIADERSRRLWTAIDALPERLRIVIVLAAIEGHGLRDVAALTGVPEGTVKSRLFEARRRLQEQLR